MALDRDEDAEGTTITEERGAAEGAEGVMEGVREGARHAYEKGVEKARELENTIENYIRERPFQSLLLVAGISLAAGLLVGTLSRR
jgi:ElaB/YqjD/DUF883 family membrane-anchored ribosome-binding protein